MNKSDAMIRRSVAVQLDMRKDEERKIFAYTQELKKKRELASKFRLAMMLVGSLESGDTDILEKYFPWVLKDTSSLT